MTNLQPKVENSQSKLTPALTAELIEVAFDVALDFGSRPKHCNFKAKGSYIYGSVGDIEVIAMKGPRDPIIITRDSDEIKMVIHESYNYRTDIPINEMLHRQLDGYFTNFRNEIYGVI